MSHKLDHEPVRKKYQSNWINRLMTSSRMLRLNGKRITSVANTPLDVIDSEKRCWTSRPMKRERSEDTTQDDDMKQASSNGCSN
ncbi:hypothetical protein KCP77_07010 [Salmonella enterica subsp. enterica]|nr:hypothetical protein KCP77_07010 [Salmonella enterica subsp. enterica]